MRTLLTVILGISILLFTYSHAQADLEANCLQEHCGLKLTSVSISTLPQTDFLLVASNLSDNSAENDETHWDDPEGSDEESPDTVWEDQIRPMPDPIEAVNRPVFTFNDKVYFWLLKPVARGYGWVLPEPARKSVKKFFYNLRAPIRIVNCVLQGKGKGALTEFYRFGINTTIGIVGFFDPATSRYHLQNYNEDFGLTLGHHMGPGCYLSIPLMGPSSLRDGTGSIVDLLIVPTWYVLQNYGTPYALVRVFETVNTTSLSIGEYEDLVELAVDPYVAVRDAYHQHREDRITR